MELEQYAAAVARMVKLAKQDHGGSRVAAQVLLSCYNGYDYQLDITDLCNLDPDNYQAAIAVIRGRCELSIEPQTTIPNGQAIFGALWHQWKHLHVEERGKTRCPICGGRRHKYASDDDEIGTPCTYCDGTGRVCQCKA